MLSQAGASGWNMRLQDAPLAPMYQKYKCIDDVCRGAVRKDTKANTLGRSQLTAAEAAGGGTPALALEAGCMLSKVEQPSSVFAALQSHSASLSLRVSAALLLAFTGASAIRKRGCEQCMQLAIPASWGLPPACRPGLPLPACPSTGISELSTHPLNPPLQT